MMILLASAEPGLLEERTFSYRRTAKMKKIVLVLSSALLALTAQGNTIVFDTFGPGDTYFQFGGYQVGGSTPLFEVAAQFTSGASGSLATVDLGLTFYLTTGAGVNVYLYGDASGLPDNASQTFLGSGAPTAMFATTNNSIVSFAVAGNVPVTMGSVYWLVLKPADANGNIWMNSLAATGSVASSLDDSTWTAATQTLPAFRITAQGAGVPDSGSTILLMLGSVAALLGLRPIFPRSS